MLKKKNHHYLRKIFTLFLLKKNLHILNKKNFSKNSFKNVTFKLIVLKKKKKKIFTGSKNICSLTGVFKSNFNSLLLNRHSIRSLGENSKLPNYTKVSW